ncbi:GntR family transcriptional regulator [Lentilactobacillus senioris]|uniref:GntR family transcriptional regulator n=1 Tax=Lentilactobacillus senioris TaxID=931534 RepID=UPI0022807D06|nr:GntR family transcriptional regulator [Lentilactobacillus senioris]MCY9805942.1 GntR family transcriptional regulator [Lentilactobacillus senioris]
MATKYENVKQDLKQKITSGEYAINQKLPTESVLMAKYKVSRYTVRRAISDLENDHFIYKIQGGGMYVDDWRQKDTHSKKENKFIGLLSTHIADYIFPNIINGVDRMISDHGYMLVISNTHNDQERERESLMEMLDKNVAGLIIEPTQSALPTTNADLYDRIRELGIPTVFINAIYPEMEADFPYVTTNDYGGERKLTNYLIEQGHKRILGIFQVDDIQGVRRMEGFTAAYREHPDIFLDAQILMYQSSDKLVNVFERIEGYLKGPDRPSAIVCYNDQLAIQVIDLVRSLDLTVPTDISVAGFDNYQIGAYIDPSLTTMMHEKEKMGHDAADLLLQLIDGKTDGKSIEYDPSLVVRGSTGPHKNKE